MAPDRARADRGQITLFWLILVPAILLFAGLAYDGSRILAAQRAADNAAGQGARAAAQSIDLDALFASGDNWLDPGDAEAAARSFLAADPDVAVVSVVVDCDEVTVTVQQVQDTAFLGMIGIDSRTVTGTSTAQAVRGVSETDVDPPC